MGGSLGKVGNGRGREVYELVMHPGLAAGEFPKLSDFNTSLMHKHLTKEIWEELKDHKTATGGWTLARAINTGCVNEDSKIGVAAGDAESYADFAKLFDPIIEKCHGGYTPDRLHVTDLDPQKLVGDIGAKNVVQSSRIRVARNLFGFPMVATCSKEQLVEVEDILKKVCESLEGDLAGEYHPIASLSQKKRKELIRSHFLYRPGDRFNAASGLNQDWPTGRGFFMNTGKTFILWINEEDHLRIISMQQGADMKAVFERLVRGIALISEGITKITGNDQAFLSNEHLGAITSCPSNLGTGLRSSVLVHLPPELKGKGLEELRELAHGMGCQLRGTLGEHTKIEELCDISNAHRLGRPEYELVQILVDCVNAMFGAETGQPADEAEEG